MTITLDPIKHTGAAPEPVVLLAEAEQLTFTGAELTDNMAATILSPTGTALASGLIAGNAVTIDTRTGQAWDYISAQACGVTAPALLAIGDADTLVAVLPIRVLRNNLYNLAPPSETVTVYPSMEQLREILARIAAADESADALLARAEALGLSIETFEETLPGMISGALGEVSDAKATALADVEAAKTGALTDVEAAKTDALGGIGDAKVAAIDEINAAEATGVAYVEEKAREALQDLEAKKQEGVTAVDAAVTRGETRLTDRTETGVGLVNQAADYAVDEINAVKQQAEAQLTPLVDQAAASRAGAEAAQAGAEQAQAGAEAARTGAENAQHGAEAAQTAAETAAGNAATSAAEAEAAAAEIADVADLAEAALPESCYELKDWTSKTFHDINLLGSSSLAAAPKGFIVIHGTMSPYASRGVSWIRPDGEMVLLFHANSSINGETARTLHPWLVYSGPTHLAGWLDDNASCFAINYSGVTYKVTVPFVDGEPSVSGTTSVAVDGATLTGSARYAKKLETGYIITTGGRIFDPETLVVTGEVSLYCPRIVTAASGVGVFAKTTSLQTARISTDESGVPIVTSISERSEYMLPSSSGVTIASSFNNWPSAIFPCMGGTSTSRNKGRAGGTVPAVLVADTSEYIFSPEGVYSALASGVSVNATAFCVCLLRFRQPLRLPNINDNPDVIALEGDGQYLLWGGSRFAGYVVVMKKETV